MWEVFAMQKLLFVEKKCCCIWDINVGNFNETLANDGISFEQLAPEDIQDHVLKADSEVVFPFKNCKKLILSIH